MSKRPKDMTQDELEALPIDAPDERAERGFYGSGKSGDDLLCFESRDGRVWRLEEGRNRWYRTEGLI